MIASFVWKHTLTIRFCPQYGHETVENVLADLCFRGTSWQDSPKAAAGRGAAKEPR